jgi:hypothetical protein
MRAPSSSFWRGAADDTLGADGARVLTYTGAPSK